MRLWLPDDVVAKNGRQRKKTSESDRLSMRTNDSETHTCGF